MPRWTLLDGKECKWLLLWIDEFVYPFRRVESSSLIYEPHLLDDWECTALYVSVLAMVEERVALLDDDKGAGLSQESSQRGPGTDQDGHGKVQCGWAWCE